MGQPRHTLFVGGSSDERRARADAAAAELRPGAVVTLDAGTLPFVRPSLAHLPASVPRVLRIDDIHLAFPNEQRSGTRFILTQSTYTMQAWLDLLGNEDVILATADREALSRGAAEAFARRGPWAAFEIVDISGAKQDPSKSLANFSSLAPGPHPRRELTPTPRVGSPGPPLGVAAGAPVSPSLPRPPGLPALPGVPALPALPALIAAFSQPDAAERRRLCDEAVKIAPEFPEAALALASACRETQELPLAHEAIDRALSLAPGWAAAHYEAGKFWLGCEDLARARDHFRRAGECMPRFASAFSNLGATLGELGDPEAALAAFEQALAADAENPTLLSNVGVVRRELGQLGASEEALRRVVALAPGFVFGHYNLGHTLFLSGRFEESLEAYLEGQQRDPDRNLRQACRLAMVRFAAGDVEGADRDLWRAADAAPPDEREDLLLEAYEIGKAVLDVEPSPGPKQVFLDRLAAAIMA